jgi:hypothetical protein
MKTKAWARYKLINKQAKEVGLGDVVHTRREGAAHIVQSWDGTKVHTKSMCDRGYCQSYYPAVFELFLVEEPR